MMITFLTEKDVQVLELLVKLKKRAGQDKRNRYLYAFENDPRRAPKM